MIVTVPLAEFVFEMSDFGPPSGFVSFASTSIAVAPESSPTVAASSTAVGGTSVGTVVVVEVDVDVDVEVDVDVDVDVLVLVVELVVLVPVLVLVVVLVVGGFDGGTRTFRTKFFFIRSGGSLRSTSWIRFARTVNRHSVPTGISARGVSVNFDAGE